MDQPTSNVPVPERKFHNDYGQEITVRLIAGKILVKHPGIPNTSADTFWEYIPTQIEQLPKVEGDVDTMEAEDDVFNVVSAPKKAPLQTRRIEIPADSPQYQLTPDELSEIEFLAGTLLQESQAISAKWFQTVPEEPEEKE